MNLTLPQTWGGWLALGISLAIWGFIIYAVIVVIKDTEEEEVKSTHNKNNKKSKKARKK